MRAANRHQRLPVGATDCQPLEALAPVCRRSRDDDSTGCLADHVLGHLAHIVVQRAPAQQAPAPDVAGLVGGQHDDLHAAAPRLVDDRLSGPPGPDHGGGHRDTLVFLPHLPGALERRPGQIGAAVGQRRLERHRHRHLKHPDRFDRRGLRQLVAVRAGQPRGRLDDVVVEGRAEHRHQDRTELRLHIIVAERPFRD